MLFEITVNINDSVFKAPSIDRKTTKLLEQEEKLFKEKYEEIKDFIGFDKDFEELSYDNVLTLFKGYWYKSILTESIEKFFKDVEYCNIYNTIFSILTRENLRKAINGVPMIEAFTRAIHNIPSSNFGYLPIRGSKILLLHEKYIRKTLP